VHGTPKTACKTFYCRLASITLIWTKVVKMGLGMGTKLRFRFFCLLILTSASSLFARGLGNSLLLYDSHGDPLPGYQLSLAPEAEGIPIGRALSAQTKGTLASSFTRYGQDATVLGYAWSLLNHGTEPYALPRMASLPKPLSEVPVYGGDPLFSVGGFINVGFNSREIYSFLSGLVGEGTFDLLSLQAPIEAILNVLFRHLRNTPGVGLAMNQVDLTPAADFIIQLYLASLIEGTSKSFPEAYAIVKEKQREIMTQLLTQVYGLARQMGGLRKGFASPPLEMELLQAIAGAAPRGVLKECIRDIQARVSVKRSEFSELQAEEIDQLLEELSAVSQSKSKKSGFGVRVIFTVIQLFQKQIPVPVALLHLVNGTSTQVASTSTIPAVRLSSGLVAQMSGLPIQLANEVVVAAYEAVQHFDTHLEADLLARYQGPRFSEVLGDLFAKIKARYHEDLRYRTSLWTGPPVETCYETFVLDAIN
jgi:hypothetical protein